MTIRKHSPGCPCCDVCPIPIAGWSEESGDWSLASAIYSTEDSNALQITTNEHPDDLSTHVARFAFTGDDEGINLIYLLHYNGNIQNLVENNHMNELSGCYSISNPVKINKTTAGECTTTSTKDISLLKQIYLYPNPARQVIHIALPEGFQTTDLMVDIMDIRGVMWFGNISITQIMRNGIDLEELPAGMYLLRLRSNQHQHVVKFIKVQ